ncbi:MAG: hypothetical protein K0Q95_719 [Bacteroidota bacterium]|nr:hypothetical protein [Bacteroidota bacterium]
MAKEHDVTLGLKRSIKEESKPVFQIFYSKVFRPSVSVDLLESSGIHLFTITNIHPLPSFSVGARFKAGLVITI